MKTKRCPECEQKLLVKEFYKDRSKKEGVSTYCRECTNRYNLHYRKSKHGQEAVGRARRKYNESKHGREKARRTHLSRRYDITLERFEQMCLDQEGHCLLCCRAVSHEDIQVDHDHKTGKVRGLLCGRCNKGIGFLGDTIKGLQRAIKYLRDYG